MPRVAFAMGEYPTCNLAIHVFGTPHPSGTKSPDSAAVTVLGLSSFPAHSWGASKARRVSDGGGGIVPSNAIPSVSKCGQYVTTAITAATEAAGDGLITDDNFAVPIFRWRKCAHDFAKRAYSTSRKWDAQNRSMSSSRNCENWQSGGMRGILSFGSSDRRVLAKTDLGWIVRCFKQDVSRRRGRRRNNASISASSTWFMPMKREQVVGLP